MGTSQSAQLMLCICKNESGGELCLNQTEYSKLFCKKHSHCKNIYKQTQYSDCEAKQVLRQLKTYIQTFGENAVVKQLYDMYNGRMDLKHIDDNKLPQDITNLIYDKIMPDDPLEMFISYLTDPNRSINELQVLIDRGAIESTKKWLKTKTYQERDDITTSIVTRLVQTDDDVLTKLLVQSGLLDFNLLDINLDEHLELIINHNAEKVLTQIMMNQYNKHVDEKSEYTYISEQLNFCSMVTRMKNPRMVTVIFDFINKHYLDDMISFLKVCSPKLDKYEIFIKKSKCDRITFSK